MENDINSLEDDILGSRLNITMIVLLISAHACNVQVEERGWGGVAVQLVVELLIQKKIISNK